MKKVDVAASQPVVQERSGATWPQWLFALLLLAGAGVLALGAYRAISAALVGEFAALWLDIWLQLLLLLFTGGVFAIGAARLSPNRKTVALAALLGLFLFLVVALPLRTTPFAIDGFGGDQRLYTAYVTKFAATAGNVDVIYPDLPAFYPPLYFYVLGRAADWLGIAPYAMLKLGMLATVALLPLAMALLWRPLLPGVLAGAAIFVLLIEQNLHKPAEWFTMILFVPWWLTFVINVRGRSFGGWRERLLWLAGGGVLGALIFQSYYYWFLIGFVSLLVGLLAPQWLGRADGSRRGLLLDAGSMLLSTALFSVLYWGPYLASMIATGGRQVLQSRWLAEGKIALPLPFTDDSLAGVFLLFGLASLVLAAGSSRVARGLLALLGGLYLWFGLGYVGMLADHPLLTFRAYPMVNYLLALGGCLGLAHLWQKRTWFNIVDNPQQAFGRLWAAAILVLCLFFGQQTIEGHVNNENVQLAIESTPPTALLEAADQLLPPDTAPPTLLVSDKYIDLFAFRPYAGFVAWSAHFSHPAGLFHQRIDLLTELAATHSPALFYQALAQNRYDPIDGLLLEPSEGGWHFRFADDNFPDRTVERTLHFNTALLAEPCFQRRAAGELTLFEPAAACPAIPAAGLEPGNLEVAALRYSLGRSFGEHITGGPQPAELAQLEAQLLAADLSSLPLPALLDLLRASEGALGERANAAFAARVEHPLDIVLREPEGGGELRVLGYNFEDAAAGGQPPALALYFEVLSPLRQDYAIWMHGVEGETNATFDHNPRAEASTWDAGAIYVDRTSLTGLPEGAALSFGFWNDASHARLARENGDTWIDLGEVGK